MNRFKSLFTFSVFMGLSQLRLKRGTFFYAFTKDRNFFPVFTKSPAFFSISFCLINFCLSGCHW